jgi:integrase
MTIGELLHLYLCHHLAGKPSAPYYERLLRQVFPPIAAFELAAVPKLELLRWWTALMDRPGHANKAIGFLRAAHHWALGLDLLTGPDPTAGIVKRPETMRSTTTSPDEWARLVPFIEDLKLRHRVYFWSLYLLGSRPGEVRTVKPEHVFLDRDMAVWVNPMTKNKRPHVKPIPEQLIPLWRLLLHSNPPTAQWLFWGESPEVVWGRTSVQKMWEGLRKKAGLPHLWLNDLRRSTASDLLNQGESLGIVQGALNHRSLSQTAKYAWLAVKPLQTALQTRADRIVNSL